MAIEHIVFYGTLMAGENTKMHSEMKNGLVYLGECTFLGNLYDLGRYPGLKPSSSSISHGELYKIVDPNLLPLLDEYEATDIEDASKPGFTRKNIHLLEPDVEAWIYYYNGEIINLNPLKEGRWH